MTIELTPAATTRTPKLSPAFLDVVWDALALAATGTGLVLSGRHRWGGASFASFLVQNVAASARSTNYWKGRVAGYIAGGRHYVNIGLPVAARRTLSARGVPTPEMEVARVIMEVAFPDGLQAPADDFGLFFGLMANTGTAGIGLLSAGGRGFGLAQMAGRFEFQSKTLVGIPAGYAERTQVAWPNADTAEIVKVEFRLFAATATTDFRVQLLLNDVLVLERSGASLPLIDGALNENCYLFEHRGGGAANRQVYFHSIRIVIGPNVPELFTT